MLDLAPEGGSGHALDAVVACAGLGPQVERRDLLVSVNYFGAVAVLDGLLDALAYGGTSAAVAICSNSISVTPMPDPRLVELMLADDEAAAVELGTVARRSHRLRHDQAGARSRAAPPRAGRGPTTTCASTWWRRARCTRRCSRAPSTIPVLGPLVGMLPVPMGRPSEPDEIAGPIAFLLSPESAMIHGSVLFIDGGSDALLRSDHV